jgi:hypothetical protein
VLVATLALTLYFPKTTLAAPAIFDPHPTAVIAQGNETFSDIELTPQFRQQLQGVRQRRNREIQKVLSGAQLTQLKQNLQAGDRLTPALDKLQLESDQRDMIKAIVKISDLKAKTILSRYSLHQ